MKFNCLTKMVKFSFFCQKINNYSVFISKTKRLIKKMPGYALFVLLNSIIILQRVAMCVQYHVGFMVYRSILPSNSHTNLFLFWHFGYSHCILNTVYPFINIHGLESKRRIFQMNSFLKKEPKWMCKKHSNRTKGNNVNNME